MKIEFKEDVHIAAPIEEVWAFVLDPDNVVGCMPGASLKQINEQDSFDGALKVTIGAVTAQFNGRITYSNVDRTNCSLEMVAEAKQYGGGTLRGVIATRLMASEDCGTDVSVVSSADITGGLIRVGRGMIEGMAGEVIKEYVANVRVRLERPVADGHRSEGAAGKATQHVASSDRGASSISILAVLFAVIRRKLKALFRRRRLGEAAATTGREGATTHDAISANRRTEGEIER
jgi:carbon monoxide dehydrogenase subunit G